MARTISAPQSLSYGTVDQGTHKQVLTYNYYISSNDSADFYEYAYKGWGYAYGPSYSFDDWVKFSSPPGTLWMNNRTMNADCDRNVYVRHYGEWKNEAMSTTYTKTVNAGPYLTWAVDPTTPNCSLVSKTSNSVTVSMTNWTPATYDTTVEIYLQYKASTSGTWLTWGSAMDAATGYTGRALSNKTVTGLAASTTYNFRCYIDRTGTANTTTAYYSGTTLNVTTDAGVPTISTVAAYNVGSTTATLRATITTNDYPNGLLSWRYHTSNPGTPNDTSGTEVTWSGNPVTSDGTKSQAISGLTGEQTYYFWAIYEYDGGTKIYGSILNFTTTATPSQLAQDQSRMYPFVYHRIRGVILTAKPLVFTLHTPAASDSNTFATAVSFATGDVKISKDGAAFANTTNLPATLGDGYTLVLTAAELQCSEADVIISDQDGPAFRDAHLRVITRLELGTFEVDVDAGDLTDTSAVNFKGVGTGHGLELSTSGTGKSLHATNGVFGPLTSMVSNSGTAQSGTTALIQLATSASTTADEYNGQVVVIYDGLGAGQARTIKDYDTSRNATVDKAFNTAPNTTSKYIVLATRNVWDELEGTAPVNADWATNMSFRKMMQFIKRRLFNKATQDASYQIIRTDGDAADLITRTITDSGATQVEGEVS